MSKIKIEFLEDGLWGDHPRDPIFKVIAGEEREVSASLAKVATDAGKARFVLPKRKPGPKPKAEGKRSGPIPKAEGKKTVPDLKSRD